MQPRLKLGSYIIDAAPGANTSTTAGLRLLLTGPRVDWVEARTSLEVIFNVQVNAADLATAKASVEALASKVTNMGGVDLVLESAPDVELFAWKVSNHLFSRIAGEIATSLGISPEDGTVSGLCTLKFTADRAGQPASAPAGAVDAGRWDFALDGNGKPSCSGAFTFQTRQQAVAWVNALRSGSGKPGFIGSAMRLASVHYAVDQQPVASGASGEAQYTPCTARVLYSALPASWAGNQAFANVIDGEVQTALAPRGPIDLESGATPGHDVLMSGSLQFKTQTADSFDGGDTNKVDESALKAATLACIEVLESQQKTIHATEWFRVAKPEVVPDAARGVVSFTLRAMTGPGGRIVAWDETLRITRMTRDARVSGSKGDVVYPHRLGPQLRCQHRLAITALAQQSYPMPSFLQNNTRWHEDYLTPGKPHHLAVEDAETGFELVLQEWEGQWTLLSDGNEQDRDSLEFSQLAQGTV